MSEASVSTSPRATSAIHQRSYRPALDGIRAVAIIGVMAYHASNVRPSGGFFSVGVFFVVSGYLITGLLLSEKARTGAVSLRSFYVRRARRLFPALVLTVLSIAIVCPLVLADQTVQSLRRDGLAAIFYYSNWRSIFQGDSYFQQFGEPSPYRHMWSLSIEEQFYLFLPIFLLIVVARFGLKPRPLILAFSALASLSAIRMAVLYIPGSDPSRVYFGTDTRAQDLLFGSALAVAVAVLRRRGLAGRTMTVIGVAAASSMAIMFLTLDEVSTATYRGGFTAFALATCALILSVELNPEGPVARVLAVSWWAWVGKISYGLYLWYWPTFIMLSPDRTGIDGIALVVVRFAVTFVLGTLSYYVVEAPIRRHGLSGVVGRSGARAIGLLTLPVTAVLVWAATGAVATLPTARFETGEQARVGWLNPAAHTRILIVGDSVGFALGFSFPQKEYPDASVVTGVVFGCGTAEQSIAVKGKLLPSGNKAECDDVFGTWADLVKYKNPNVVVWSLGGWEVFDHVLDGKVRRVTSPEYAKHVRSRLEVGLAELGPDVKVVIPNVPCYDQPSVSLHGEDMADDRNDPSRGRAVNKILGEFANDHDNVTIFDVASQVCPGGKFVEKIDGVKIRSDGVHYTADGVRFFWKWIMPALEDLVAKSR